METTKEQKLAIFKSLPEDLRTAMSSQEAGEFILSLNKKYQINYDRLKKISGYVGDIFLGLLPIQNLNTKIAAVLGKNPNETTSIEKDIISALIDPVRPSLTQFLNSKRPSIDQPRPEAPKPADQQPQQFQQTKTVPQTPQNQPKRDLKEIEAPHNLELPGAITVKTLDIKPTPAFAPSFKPTFASQTPSVARPAQQSNQFIAPKPIATQQTLQKPATTGPAVVQTPAQPTQVPKMHTLQEDVEKIQGYQATSAKNQSFAAQKLQSTVSIPRTTTEIQTPIITPLTTKEGKWTNDPYREPPVA